MPNLILLAMDLPIIGNVISLQQDLSRVSREDLQRSLGVRPMDKSSRFRGVSKKKGKWEAKVMLNRKWAYRGTDMCTMNYYNMCVGDMSCAAVELFNSEEDAARAYDRAVRRLKPNEARAYLNFKVLTTSLVVS